MVFFSDEGLLRRIEQEKRINMPAKAEVFIQYGPYNALGVVDHRTSRLEGLQAVLTKAGHQVKLVEVPDWNCMQILVHGEAIFKCDIRELDYGGDGELDKLCRIAKEAVNEAY